MLKVCVHPLLEKRTCDVTSALRMNHVPSSYKGCDVLWCKCVNKGAKWKVVCSEVRVLPRSSWEINKMNNQWCR
jgi:hypothetical protein